MARILVVDPEEGARARFAGALAREGYDVDVAASGPEALRRLGEIPADLVVSEVRLPGMDGLELLLRILDGRPKTKVVLQSTSLLFAERFTSWAADALLLKSADPRAILAEVRKLLPAVSTARAM